MTRSCVVEGCDQPHLARGFCGTHYWRDVHGKPLDDPIRQPLSAADKEQIRVLFDSGVTNCAEVARRLGVPHATVYTFAKRAKLPVQRWRQPPQCSVDGCGKPAVGAGLCTGHYQRTKKGQALDEPLRVQVCLVCESAMRSEIERLILLGAPSREVSAASGIPRTTIRGHSYYHLGWRQARGYLGDGCPICASPNRDEVEALMRKKHMKRKFPLIAELTGAGHHQITNHYTNHLDNAEYAANRLRHELSRLEAVKRWTGDTGDTT